MGTCVAVVGGLGLVGWVTGIEALKSVLPGLPTMKANTALGFLSLGLTLVLFHAPAAWAPRRALLPALPLVALAIGTLTIVEIVGGVDLGIDEALFRDAHGNPPGRPSLVTAMGLAVSASAMLLLAPRNLLANVAAQALGALVHITGLLALVAYLLGAEGQRAAAPFASVSIITAAALTATGAAIVIARPGIPPASALLAPTPSAGLARRIMLALIALVPALGWLRLQGQRAGYYETEFGLALMVTICIATLGAVTWIGAAFANRTDRQLARIRRLYATLSETNQAIVWGGTEIEVLGKVCEAAVAKGRFAAAWIGWIAPDRGITVAVERGTTPEFTASVIHLLADPERRTALVNTLASAKVYVENDIGRAGIPESRRRELSALMIQSAAVLPILLDGHLVAGLFVYSPERSAFGPEEIALLAEMASDLGYALGQFEAQRIRRLAEHEILELNVGLERRVTERTRDLEVLNRELESFSYSVSHDLRAPLRAIDGYASLIAAEHPMPPSDPARGYLEQIRRASGHMASLIDGLLGVAHLATFTLHREEVDLSALAREIVSQSAPNAARVRWIIADNLQHACDPALVRSLLQNLLLNAAKFSAPTAQPVVEFGIAEPGPRRIYFVRDNGTGFDMREAGSLFRLFKRLHSGAEFPGTGIGLATVKRVAEKHGGTVWAESTPGHGATFFFTLDAAPAQDSAENVPSGARAPT